MSGKGSKPRPFSVSQNQFANNWEQAFAKSNNNLYLVAINPWYKIYYDSQKNKSVKIPYK